MQDELIASYMTVLNEGVESSEVKGATPKAGSDALGDFKKGNDSDENVDLDKPSDDKELSSNVKKGTPKKLKESKFQNPFDDLYNKIVNENSFGFSTEDENEIEPTDDFASNLEGDLGQETDELGDISDDLSGEEDMDIEGLEDEEQGEEIDLGVLVGTLKDVLSQLEKIVGDEEGEEEEIEDIEDIEDTDDEEGMEDSVEEDESEEEGEEEEEESKNPFGEGKTWKAEKSDKKKSLKKKSKKPWDDDKEETDKSGRKPVVGEAVSVKGLKKGVNLTPFKGNIKPLQSKKAEVTGNNPKASKGKAQTPSTGKGYDGAINKMSPSAGHNLMKPSSHTVSGAVKAGKSLFEQ